MVALKRFNLIRETNNIRNTIRPKRKKEFFFRPTVYMAIVIGTGIGYYMLFPPQYADRPMNLVEKIAKGHGERLPQDKSITKISDLVANDDDDSNDNGTPLRDAESAAPDEMLETDVSSIEPAATAKPVDAALVAPDEKINEEVATPVLTRPVAQEVKFVPPPSTGSMIWRIRLGLCLRLQSCQEIAATLAKKRIKTTIEKGSAAILTQRLMVGPWATETQGMAVSEQLADNQISTSPLTANGKNYLVTAPIKNAHQMKIAQTAIESLKLDYTVARKREPRQVHKVYAATTYTKRAEANNQSLRLRKLNIDNIIELQK